MADLLPWEQYNGEATPLPVVPQMAQLVNAQPQQQPAEQPGFFANLMGKLQSDPAANMALMAAGARMLQGRAPGQSVGGGIADAIMQGAAAHAGVQENQRAVEMAQSEEARKQSESVAKVEGQRALTESTKQSTKFAAEKQPMELDKLKQDVITSSLKLKIAQSEQAVQAAVDAQDPGGVARAKNQLDTLKATLAEHQARTRVSNAAAEASSAAADHSRAGTAYETNRVVAQQMLLNPDAPQEMKDTAGTILNNAKTPAGQKKDEIEMHAKVLRRIDPTLSEADSLRIAYDDSFIGKGNRLSALAKILDDPMATDDQKADARNGIMQIAKPNSQARAGSSGGAGTQQNPVLVKSTQEAAKLAAGTYYKTPDGKLMQR